MTDVDTDLGSALSDALTLLLGCRHDVRWCPLHGWTITIPTDECAAELVDKLAIAVADQRFRVDEMARAVEEAGRFPSGELKCCGGFDTEHVYGCGMAS